MRGADGRRIGWYGLSTGTTQLVDPDPGAAAEVQAAVDAYAAATSPLRRRRVPGSPVSRVPAPRAAPVEPRDHALPRDHAEPRDPGLPRGLHRARADRPTEPDPCHEDRHEYRHEDLREDLRDRFAGEHLMRLLAARVVARGPAPSGRGRWAARDPLGAGLRHAHRAVLGQQRVGLVLAGLAPPWHVLHSVPTSDRSCLDHLLVGPGGVVVLRTVAHPDEALRVTGDLVRADGNPVSHVRLLRRQVETVADRLRGADLPVRVRGVVVVVGARSVRAGDLPAGVSVVRLGNLARWVAGLPTVLSQVDVARLAGTAAREGTWPTGTDGPTGRRPQQQRERDRAALARLTVQARDTARWRRSGRVVVGGAACAAAASLLPLLRPELVPYALAALAGG